MENMFEVIMSDLFNEKYRIESIRLSNWDYASDGYYFVTICTNDRINYFGQIINNKFCVSIIGEIVLEEWLKTDQKRKNVILDEYIIMPNHFHGIVILEKSLCYVGMPVETLRATSLRTENEKSEVFSQISPKSGSLSAIIRAFKSSVSKRCHENGFEFEWQERYYERIIRDENELYRIRKYIRLNVLWH